MADVAKWDDSSELSLVQALLRMKPSPLRRTTLLEALEMSRAEVPQSLFLAWLLGPQGPLTDCWLLKEIFETAVSSTAVSSVPWPGMPQSVLPEVQVETERPDVVVTWDSFRLIVEYKVDSPEGKYQVSRYLDTFRITNARDGMVVYLTPTGKWPTSVKEEDRRGRIYPLSFDQLIGAINRGLNSGLEKNERGKAMVAEYRDCLRCVLNRSINMEKPVISEATKLLSQNHEHFERLLTAAKQEAADMINYAALQAEKEMRSIIVPDMVVTLMESWGYFMFRRPEWVAGELEYGFTYGSEGKPGSRTMNQYEHNIAIRVQPIERGTNGGPKQKALAESLRAAIWPHIPGKPDRWLNQWFAYCKDVPLKAGDDWDKWTENMVRELGQLGRCLTKHIDDFAARFKLP